MLETDTWERLRHFHRALCDDLGLRQDSLFELVDAVGGNPAQQVGATQLDGRLPSIVVEHLPRAASSRSVKVPAGPHRRTAAPRQVLRLDCYVVSKQTGEVLSDQTVYAVTSLAPDRPAQTSCCAYGGRTGASRACLHAGCGLWAKTTPPRAHQAFAGLSNLVLSMLHLWRGLHVTAAREDYAPSAPRPGPPIPTPHSAASKCRLGILKLAMRQIGANLNLTGRALR